MWHPSQKPRRLRKPKLHRGRQSGVCRGTLAADMPLHPLAVRLALALAGQARDRTSQVRHTFLSLHMSQDHVYAMPCSSDHLRLQAT